MSTTSEDNEKHFRTLFAEAYEDVLRFVQRRAVVSNAEDVTADAFLVAWRRIREAPARPSEQRAWLFGIARKCLLNANRGLGRRDALAVRVLQSSEQRAQSHSDSEIDFAIQRMDLAAAWRRLSEVDQEALALAVFESLTSAQAAKVLDVTPLSYRLRLFRARRALRNQLASDQRTAYQPTENLA